MDFERETTKKLVGDDGLEPEFHPQKPHILHTISHIKDPHVFQLFDFMSS